MGIAEKTKKGIFWVLVGQFGYEAILFVASVILARILEPNEFGIAGVAVLITNYMKRLRNFGFGLAIVQKKHIAKEHLNAVFVANMVLGLILWIAVFLASDLIAEFFNSPISGDVAKVTALTFLINPFSSVQSAYLKRHMDFKNVTKVKIGADLVMNGAMIAMALMGYGVWSLAWPRLLEPLIMGMVLGYYTKYWPGLKFSKEAMKEIFSFGIWVFIRAQVTYFTRNVDNMIVVRFLGTTSLGFYERAKNVMNRPQKRISGRTRQVLLSAFSRLQEQPERVRSAFRKVMLSMSIVNIPVQLGLLVVAPAFVNVVFGPKWMPIVTTLQILNISGLINAITITMIPIITAHGRVKENAIRTGIGAVFFAGFGFAGVRYGIEGVAVGMILYRLVDLLLVFTLIRRITLIRFLDLLASTTPGMVCAFIMAGIVYGYQMLVQDYIDPLGIIMLTSSVGIGVASYILLLFLFRFKEFVEVRNELLDDLKPIFVKIKTKLVPGKAVSTE